jgi:hypothetical protein
MLQVSLDIPQHEQVVGVRTTDNRGFNPEELANQCVKKIIATSEDTHPVLREQAREFSSQIEKIIVLYMRQAVNSDRTTVCNAINEAGHPQLAEHIRRL